jgi:endonuclease III
MSTGSADVERLIMRAGITYAQDSGIGLKNKPMPLFQLLTLAMLASKPIHAQTAVRAARELFDSGLRTPRAVLAADRQTMIEAFGRAGYARYDESSAARLVEIARLVNKRYRADLRGLAQRADHDVERARELLQQFPGIGETGADIFLREVQDTWLWVRPYFDGRCLGAARRLGLPDRPGELGALAPRRNARLAAALVRASLDDALLDALS